LRAHDALAMKVQSSVDAVFALVFAICVLAALLLLAG